MVSMDINARRALKLGASVGTVVLCSIAANGAAHAQDTAQPAAVSSDPPAPAQPASPASPAAPSASAIGDIVVTANRRAESVQRSALAIQAFNTATIQKAGIAQASDLSKLVQGIQVGVQGSTTSIYIRGVGSYSGNSLSNPGVAFNVDGVYVGRPEGVSSNFYDIARMEVLKGPQGTLYGRNASGGAINLITNNPTFDGFHGVFNGEAGNYNLFHIDGALNLPLSDTLAVRIAGNRIKRDGYLSDGTSDDNEYGVRAKVLFKPSTDFSLLVSGDVEGVRGKGGGFVYLPKRPGASHWEGSTSPAANAYIASNFNPLLLPGGDDSFTHNNFYNISAQMDWNLGFATLTVIPAYRRAEFESLTYDASSTLFAGKADQTTGEVRLSHAGSKLKWVAGFYYFHETDPGIISVNKGVGVLKADITYNPTGTAYAGFGEATLTVLPRLRLIAGGRYTSENRKLDGSFFIYPTQGTDFVDIEDFFGNKTFNSATWKAGAEYDLAPSNLLFFTASTGFKSGGITQTVPPDNIYKPEKILAFTLGSKNRFFGNRLQINVEAFHWTYSDQQNNFLSFDSLGVNNFTTVNAGKAKIYGFNLDVVGRVTQRDTVHGALEYAHSRYTSFNYKVPFFAYSPATSGCRNLGPAGGTAVPLVSVDCSGFELPHAPRWSGSADYTHSFELANGGTLDATFSGRASSKTWLQIDFTRPERAPSFAILNADLTYRAPSGKYSITLYVRNFNNGVEYTGGQVPSFAGSLFASSISPPRTFGAQAHVSW